MCSAKIGVTGYSQLFTNIVHYKMILSRTLKQIIIFFWLTQCVKVYSSHNFTPEDVQKGLNIALGEVRKNYQPNGVFESDFLFFGDSMIINPIGTHYVFSYKKGNNFVRRLDKSIYHGHNFSRFLFKYKNDIYALGGYGFWNGHSKLLKYNWIDREWDLIRLESKLPDIEPSLSLKTGDSIYLIYDIKSSEQQQEIDRISECYLLNLRNLSVSRVVNVKNYKLVPSINQYHTLSGDWMVWGEGHTISHFYNQKTKEFYINFSGPWPFRGKPQTSNHQDSNWLIPEGEYLHVFSKDNDYDKINIEQYTQLYCEKIQGFPNLKIFEESNNPKLSYQLWIWVLILFVVFVIIGLVLVLRNRNHLKYSKNRYKEYYAELNNSENDFKSIFQLYFGTYSEKELDISLQIIHLPKDIRNLKRSQLLFELNQKKPGFIKRKIDPNKKNQFVYEVNNY